VEVDLTTKVLRYAFLTLFVTLFAVPSAAFTWFKYAVFGALGASLILFIIKHREHVDIPKSILLSLSLVCIAVALGLVVALIRGTFRPDTLFELRSFGLIVFEVFAGTVVVRARIVKWEELAKLFVLAVVIYSFLKLFFLIFVYFYPLQGIALKTLLFPDAFMGGYVLLDGFYRLVAVNDYYLPAAYVVAGLANLEERKSLAVKIVLLFFVFISFSRFLWLETAALIVVVSWFSNRKLFTPRRVLAVVAALLVVLTLAQLLGADIIGTFRVRFVTEGGLSLNYKFAQIRVLTEEFLKYPVFGKGLGSTVERFPKQWKLKTGWETHAVGYSYEVFNFLLLVQFGIVGSLLLAAGVYVPIFAVPDKKKRIFVFLCVSAFLASGFTNPVIINAPTGLFMCLWYGFSQEVR